MVHVRCNDGHILWLQAKTEETKSLKDTQQTCCDRVVVSSSAKMKPLFPDAEIA